MAEAKLKQALALSGIDSVFQAPVGPYIADFLVKPQKLVVEADGASHMFRGAYDRKRDRYMWLQGYTVLRFSNDEILGNAQAVVEQIRERLIRLGAKNV